MRKRNHKLLWLIREGRDASGEPWTVEKIAQEIYSSRAHVTEVLHNKPGRGGKTRPKLARFFKKHYPGRSAEILECLGWDEDGTPVSRGTFHGEHN